MNQKYGLLYANTSNLGDDIQALAAKQFLPQVDYYIERDSIQNFAKVSHEQVKTIMNAWWCFNHNSWTPPFNINPLLISMHIDPTIFPHFTTQESKKYCDGREFGARDEYTYDQLIQHGFSNVYLSYCLTLTFPHYEGTRNNDILYVDAEGYDNNPKLTHIIESLTKLKPQERLQLAEERLEIYKKAKLVVTSRLHCALPCIAFGTPVFFVQPSAFLTRLFGYEKILSYRQPIYQIRNNLIQKCQQFISTEPHKN